MNLKKRTFYVTIMAMFLFTPQTSNAVQGDFTMQIEVAKKQINYGNPFVLTIIMKCQQQQIFRFTGKPAQVTTLDGLDLRIRRVNDHNTHRIPFRLPLKFTIQDSKGLQYKSDVVIFCDLYEEREKLKKNIIFDKPGNYALTVVRHSKMSNTIDMLVEPSEQTKEAMSLLSDLEDFAFLIGGEHKSPSTVEHLQQVIERSEDTLLAKWSAARLGIEYFKDFQKKHPSIEKFKAGLENDGIKDPLYQKACKYLTTGAQLPDEFTIREEVLWNLCSIEHIRGNFDKAISLLDELSTKYPKGIYDQKASESKAQLLKEPKKQASEKQGDTKNQ